MPKSGPGFRQNGLAAKSHSIALASEIRPDTVECNSIWSVGSSGIAEEGVLRRTQLLRP